MSWRVGESQLVGLLFWSSVDLSALLLGEEALPPIIELFDASFSWDESITPMAWDPKIPKNDQTCISWVSTPQLLIHEPFIYWVEHENSRKFSSKLSKTGPNSTKSTAVRFHPLARRRKTTNARRGRLVLSSPKGWVWMMTSPRPNRFFLSKIEALFTHQFASHYAGAVGTPSEIAEQNTCGLRNCAIAEARIVHFHTAHTGQLGGWVALLALESCVHCVFYIGLFWGYLYFCLMMLNSSF